MNVIYLSSVCAQSRFDNMVKTGRINSQFQNQKFHNLLLTGLAEIDGMNIRVISFPPQKRTSQKIYRLDKEEEKGINYTYPGYIDLPVINPVSRFFTTLKCIISSSLPNTVVVCNIMNYEECLAALFIRMFRKIKVCAIVADVPGLTSGANKKGSNTLKSIISRIFTAMMVKMNKYYDSYMLLTNAMNDVVNKRHKPYAVVEGMSDMKMKYIQNNIAEKNKKMTIMYAGGLHKEYGICWLIDSFRKIKSDNVELHIYGRGNYEREIEEIAKIDGRIKFFGTKSNSEIVLAQTKAHLLINPRPTNADFVKYSFPSKVLECMASGTPLLTTVLPGMPQEYYSYVYLITEETEKGLCSVLNRLVECNPEELHAKGLKAKEFVLENKNNKIQATKLVCLLNKMK